MSRIRELWKGVAISLAIAVPSYLLGLAFPIAGGPVIAIIAGMAIAIFLRQGSSFAAGIRFTSKKVLQWAVILLGFGMTALAFGMIVPGSAGQIALLAFHTLFTASVITLGYALVLNLSQPQQRATATSLIVLVQNALGNGFGALLTGVLSDMFSLETSMLFITGSYMISALAFFLSSFTYEKDLAKVKPVTVSF